MLQINRNAIMIFAITETTKFVTGPIPKVTIPNSITKIITWVIIELIIELILSLQLLTLLPLRLSSFDLPFNLIRKHNLSFTKLYLIKNILFIMSWIVYWLIFLKEQFICS